MATEIVKIKIPDVTRVAMKSELNSKIATEVGKICIPDASAIVKKTQAIIM